MSDHTDDPHDVPAQSTPGEPTPSDVPPDAVTASGDIGGAVAAPAQKATPKIAIGLAIVVALAAGGTIFALRSASTGGSLDEGVPADVVAFGRLSLRPDGDQRAAIDSLLARLPEAQGERFRESIEQGIETAFEARGLSYAQDVQPWLGAEIGFVIPTLSQADFLGGGPTVIAMLAVRDHAAARVALDRLTEDGEAYEIANGIAYIAERASTLGPFVDRTTTEATLADDADYAAAVGSLGRGVGFLWADGSALAGPGGVAPGIPTGTFAVAARVTADAIEIEGRAFGATTAAPGGAGSPDLVEASTAGQLGSLSIFGIGSALEGISDALPLIPGLRPADVLGPFNAIGIDPVNDLAPWLRGEFSIVVGGFAGVGLPTVGAIIESTDDEALGRTLAALEENIGVLGRSLGIPLEANRAGDSLSIGADGIGAFISRRPGKVAIASTPDFANELLRGAPDPLGEDAIYRAAMGETGEGTLFQAYVRIDRIRDLAVGFMRAEDREEYDATAGPVVNLLEALAIRASSADGGSFLMRLTLSDG